jgi:hydroxymethylbilane synthase
MPERPIIIATRGSALALAQANLIAAQCREYFPQLRFELKIIKTTGDKMQTSSLVEGGLPKGLFTKELEVALAEGDADMAVHSLKDLPTELPSGLILAATTERADVRDVIVYRSAGGLAEQSKLRGFKPNLTLADFPKAATIATCSTRRKVQLLAARPDFKIVEIRGNVPTRLQKIAGRSELDATVLALAGLVRLNFQIKPDGKLAGNEAPDGLLATILDLDVMLPCVGQGAIGVEIRADDERITKICERLNHFNTFQSTAAERTFLHAMGGGCQSPVAAHAEVIGDKISMRAASYTHKTTRRFEAKSPVAEAVLLGERAAVELK